MVWIKGKITLQGGVVVQGDCVGILNDILDENGEIKETDIIKVYDLTGKNYPVWDKVQKAGWIESVLLPIEYQIGKKLVNRYEYEKNNG